MTSMTGGCMCGRIRYTAEVQNDEAYLCHCRMCQRAHRRGVDRLQEYEEGRCRLGASSPIIMPRRRSPSAASAAHAGRRLSFQFADDESENLDLTVGSFDDPSRFKPKHHFGVESMHRAWINTEGLARISHRAASAAHRPLDGDRWQAPRLDAQFHVASTAPSSPGTSWAMGARPVVLLHGLFSDADTNWIKFGHADDDRRARLPRDHARSARARAQRQAARCRAPIRPTSSRDDGLALIAHLGLTDYDLGGYSLGGRTAVRMVAMGAQPRRLIVSGMGLQGLLETGAALGHFKHDPDQSRHASSAARPNGWPRRSSRPPAAIPRRCCLCSTASSIRSEDGAARDRHADPGRCPAPTTTTMARRRRSPTLLPDGALSSRCPAII